MKLKSAFSWTLASVFVRYGIKLLGNLTLARLLTPEDFGLTAIVLSVVNGVQMLTDIGTRPALIRSHRTDDDWLDTAWTLGLVRSIAIAAIIVVAAWPLAIFFEDDRLGLMIALSGSMSLLSGLTNISVVMHIRDLQAKQIVLVETAAAIAGYLVMLTWAWLAPSAWALLSGSIVSIGAFTAASFIWLSPRPVRIIWNWDVVRELVGFGKWIFLSSVLGFFILQGDRFGVGKLVGIGAAGVYSIGLTWAMSLRAVFDMLLTRLYMPVIAKMARSSEALTESVSKLRRSVLSAMIIPFAFGFGCAEELIGLLYPNNYASAGPIMQILVVSAWFGVLEFVYNDQLMVNGEPGWLFQAQLTSVAAMAGALWWVASTEVTAIAIAWIFTGGSTIRAAYLLIALDRNDVRRVLPDLAIVALFLGLSVVVDKAASATASYTSPLIAVVVCASLLGPLGLLVATQTLRRIFRFTASFDDTPLVLNQNRI